MHDRRSRRDRVAPLSRCRRRNDQRPPPPEHGARRPGRGHAIPPGVEVYDVAGPFFFGAAEQFKDTLAAVSRKPRVLVVRMRRVPFIDSTGLNVLRDLVRRTQADGTTVIIAEIQDQPRQALQLGEFVDSIGSEHIVRSLELAIATSGQIAAEKLKMRRTPGV